MENILEKSQIVESAQLTDFIIKPDDIELITAPLTTRGWNLALINRTLECFELAQLKPRGAAWGKWFPIPKTCRTCNLGSYEACYRGGKWQIIIVMECNDTPFDIRISTQTGRGAEFPNIKPKCDVPGGVIGIDP